MDDDGMGEGYDAHHPSSSAAPAISKTAVKA